MPEEKNLAPYAIASITSGVSIRDPDDHTVALAAITSKVISIGDVGISLTGDQKNFILQRLNFDGLVTLDDLPVGATFMIEKIENLQIPEALEILKETYEEFQDDFNYPLEDLDLIERLINSSNATQVPNETLGKVSDEIEKKTELLEIIELEKDLKSDTGHRDIVDWDLQVRLEAAIITYHSPYPEVRSVVDPFDDPSTPVETVRMYVIAIIWVAIGAFVNQFFELRFPGIGLPQSVVQIFLYPSGKLWYSIFPDITIPLGKFSFRLNPGPWNYKEQMLATIMYSVYGAGSYVTSNIFAQRMPMFYNNLWVTWGYQVLLALSTNYIGFGFAGVLRRFACYPVRAIWPTLLPTLALNQALLKPDRKENINGWTISRYNFFFGIFGILFLYFWIPNYLFQALQMFNWMTWIAPDNVNLAMITGSWGGLGLNPIPSFDFSVLLGGSLYYPWYSQWNNYLGLIISFFIILIVWYKNGKWTSYLPINSNGIFNNKGERYRVSKILDENGLFDQKKYDAYGPPFYSAANLVLYGSFFALYPFGIFYESIMRWKDFKVIFLRLYKTIREWKGSAYDQLDDPHSRMMARYKEVPDWWFGVVLVISFVLAVLCVQLYRDLQTPVWGIVFALAINFVFLIPLTALASSTGFGFGLNVLVELIVGYALPGNSQALMFLKALGYNIDGQAQNYVSDQKMGHYAKIPPRALFRGQFLAVFIGTFISLAVANWQINGGIPNLCEANNTLKFTCPGANTFFSASVFWGTIGPKRVFGGLYPVLQYCFLIGFLAVFPAVAFKYYGPKKWTRSFQPTIILLGFLSWAPGNLSYSTGGMYLGFAFMYYIRKKYLTWWEKYNYVLSSAILSGIAFSAIIIFFAVQYHDKSISWWGNDVPYNGVDRPSTTLLDVADSAPDGYFGPRIGNFP